MKTSSYIKPSEPLKLDIKGSTCNIFFYNNINTSTDEYGNTIYQYDLYVLYDIPYHNNLEKNITSAFDLWLEKAIDKENAEPEYTEEQRLQQEVTDLMIENIEQGQQITDLELLILGGNE